MTTRLRQNVLWIAAWLALAFVGAVWLARIDLERFTQTGEFGACEPYRADKSEREPRGDPGHVLAQTSGHLKIVTWVISFFT